MLREAYQLMKEVKEEDTLYSLGLFTATVISFLVNILELVLEIIKHIDFVQRVIKDLDGKVIVELKKDGIEKEMGWSNWCIIYTQEDANKELEEYTPKYRASDLLTSWLKLENHTLANQVVMKATRCQFQDTTNKSICFLCRILWKHSNIRFEKDLYGFPYMMNNGGSIR